LVCTHTAGPSAAPSAAQGRPCQGNVCCILITACFSTHFPHTNWLILSVLISSVNCVVWASWKGELDLDAGLLCNVDLKRSSFIAQSQQFSQRDSGIGLPKEVNASMFLIVIFVPKRAFVTSSSVVASFHFVHAVVLAALLIFISTFFLTVDPQAPESHFASVHARQGGTLGVSGQGKTTLCLISLPASCCLRCPSLCCLHFVAPCTSHGLWLISSPSVFDCRPASPPGFSACPPDFGRKFWLRMCRMPARWPSARDRAPAGRSAG